MTLSEKLVILRKKAGMTQGDLARALEVSRQSVHKWEAGQCYPEAQKLIGMKAIFGVSIDDLLDDAVDIEIPEKKTARARSEMSETPSSVDEKEEQNAQNEPEAVQKTAPVSNYTENSAPADEPALEEIRVEVIENTKAPFTSSDEQNEKEENSSVSLREKAEPEADAEKKKGFFSKLFGRR